MAEVDRKELTVQVQAGPGPAPAPTPTPSPIAGLDQLLAVVPLVMLGGMTVQMARTARRKG